MSAIAGRIGILANKKGPRGSLCAAHGRISPGGYTALPTRFPTTRMSVVFMAADNKGLADKVSTEMMGIWHLPCDG
jgi:hypothetical protein